MPQDFGNKMEKNLINLNTTLLFAEKLVIKLGKHIYASRHRIKIVVQKDIVDICSNIDKEVEAIAIEAISKKFPGYNIYSEECGFVDKKSEYTWYLDPIDGTKEYFRDLPYYATCLSLDTKTQILLGAVYSPIVDRLYSAKHPGKAFRNHQTISVNQANQLNKSIIYGVIPTLNLNQADFDFSWKMLKKLTENIYRLRGTVHNMLELCFVANGLIEGFITIKSPPTQKWHDVSAGILMVQQACGKVTDIYGHQIENRDLSNGIVATNGKIHDQIIKIINSK